MTGIYRGRIQDRHSFHHRHSNRQNHLFLKLSNSLNKRITPTTRFADNGCTLLEDGPCFHPNYLYLFLENK